MKLYFPTLGLAWAALIMTTLLSLQGSLLRASGAASACDRNWLLCFAFPDVHSNAVWLDGGHRLLSLLAFIVLIYLVRRTWTQRQVNPGLWYGSSLSLFLFTLASILGALTVVLGLTADVSMARGLWAGVHLLNSALLVSTLSMSLVYAQQQPPAWPLATQQQSTAATVMLLCFALLLLLSFSGVLTAMGNALQPDGRVGNGSEFLGRLRMLHPMIGLASGVFLLLALGLIRYLKPVSKARPYLRALLLTFGIQGLIGTGNFAFLGTLALQLLHSSLALVSFALLSLFCLYTLAYSCEHHGAVFSRRAFRPVKDG